MGECVKNKLHLTEYASLESNVYFNRRVQVGAGFSKYIIAHTSLLVFWKGKCGSQIELVDNL
jgi:hypothetical protein